MTIAQSAVSYLENVYRWIESKKLPTCEEYSDTNAWNYFQILAWHPYPNSVTSAITTCDNFYSVAKEHGDGDKKVWLTEIGFSEDRFGGGANTAGREDAQNRINDLYKELLESTKTKLPYVETMFLFRLSDCYTTPISDYEDYFGLFYAPGDPVNKGKPKPYTETIYKFFQGQDADTSPLYWYSAAEEE